MRFPSQKALYLPVAALKVLPAIAPRGHCMAFLMMHFFVQISPHMTLSKVFMFGLLSLTKSFLLELSFQLSSYHMIDNKMSKIDYHCTLHVCLPMSLCCPEIVHFVKCIVIWRNLGTTYLSLVQTSRDQKMIACYFSWRNFEWNQMFFSSIGMK